MARAQEQLVAVDDAISGVEERAANVRAGYVYVEGIIAVIACRRRR